MDLECCESIKSVEVSTNPDQTHLNHQTKEDYLKITDRCRFGTELRRIMQDQACTSGIKHWINWAE